MLYVSGYLLVSSFIIGAARTWIVAVLPQVYAQPLQVIQPNTLLLVGLLMYGVLMSWAAMDQLSDVPSFSAWFLDVLWVFYRTPTAHQGYPRLAALITRFAYAAATLFGVTLGIYGVSVFGATSGVPNVGGSFIGQPFLVSAFFTRGNALAFVFFIEFVRSLVHLNTSLGNDPAFRFWPRYDHVALKVIAPYTAALETSVAVVSLLVFGGLASWDFVLGTAMVSGNKGDTGYFVGMLFAGNMAAFVLSYALYVFPWLSSLSYSVLRGHFLDPLRIYEE